MLVYSVNLYAEWWFSINYFCNSTTLLSEDTVEIGVKYGILEGKCTVFMLDDSCNCQHVVVSSQSVHIQWQDPYSKHWIVEASYIKPVLFTLKRFYFINTPSDCPFLLLTPPLQFCNTFSGLLLWQMFWFWYHFSTHLTEGKSRAELEGAERGSGEWKKEKAELERKMDRRVTLQHT